MIIQDPVPEDKRSHSRVDDDAVVFQVECDAPLLGGIGSEDDLVRKTGVKPKALQADGGGVRWAFSLSVAFSWGEGLGWFRNHSGCLSRSCVPIRRRRKVSPSTRNVKR